jgi:integrase
LRKIDSFTPKIDPSDWAVIEEFVRSAVRDAGPDRYTTAQPWLSSVAHFVQWSVNAECLPLDREVIFHPKNIFAFVAQRNGSSSAAQGTTRSELLRISARLIGENSGATEDRRSYNASVGHRPYSASEKRGLRSYVEGQATQYRRDNLRTVVALCAGAGLTAVDLLRMNPSDVEDRGDMVVAHVPGKNARTIPLLSEWEDLARTALALADPALPLVLQNNVKYRSGNAIADMLWSTNGVGVKPHCQRLRSTWIVDHLNAGTHVSLLLDAAGVSQVSTFQRYLQHVTPRPIGQNLDALRLGGRHV